MAKEFSLRNGTLFITTEAPGGIYNSAQLKKIAELCENEAAIIKATEDQRIALFVKPEEADAISKQLSDLGLGVRHYQQGLHQPTACIGELCPMYQQDALGTAMNVSEVLSDIRCATPLKIGINGCATCCVPTHTLDISVVGDTAGYRVSLGGKNSQIPEFASFVADSIPADALPLLLQKVVKVYLQHAEEGETLQETMERVGASPFIVALAPYSQDAAHQADPFSKESGDLPLTGMTEGMAGPSQAMESEGIAGDDLESLADDTDLDNLDIDPAAMSGEGSIGEVPIDSPGESDLSESLDEYELAPGPSAETLDDIQVADLDDHQDQVPQNHAKDEEIAESIRDIEMEDEPAVVGIAARGSEEEQLQDLDESYPESVLEEESLRDFEEEILEEVDDEIKIEPSLEGLDTHHDSALDREDLEELEDEVLEEGKPSANELHSSSISGGRRPSLAVVDSGDDVRTEKVRPDDAALISDLKEVGQATQPRKLADHVESPRTASSVPSPRSSQNMGNSDGVLVLKFPSGLSVSVDPNRVHVTQPTELSIGDRRVQLIPRGDGVDVEVDGIAVFLPHGKAS